MRIRALSVFEGIVYHSHAVDLSNPCRPTLEVEALVREGDVDSGPLHLALAEYLVMIGQADGRRCVAELRQRGFVLFDVQQPSAHLQQMGAECLPREVFLRRLRQAVALPVSFGE